MSFNQSTQYTYDELNRLAVVTYGSDNRIVYAYDPAGNPTSVKVEAGAEQESAQLQPSTAPCPHCGTDLPLSARFCLSCGNRVGTHAPPPPVAPVERFCSRCGQPIRAGKSFCTACGTRV